MIAPELFAVFNRVQHRLQPGTIQPSSHHAGHEWEYGNISFVTDVHTLFVVVNGGVAVRLLFGAPVEIVNVAGDGVLNGGILLGVIGLANEVGDLFHGPRHHAYPADQVHVKFAWVWRLRTGVIVQARGENMSFVAASPSVGFFCRERGSVIGFHVAALGFAEPLVLPFQERIEFLEIR